MTRSHKYNDPDHHHDIQQEHLPKFFAKSGHVDVAPNKTKKDGGGKGNWHVTRPASFSFPYLTFPRGRSGDEILDEDFNFKPRRRSNSSVEHGPRPFKTKFETVEAEPVFEEESMGPNGDYDDSSVSDTMSKTDTDGGSIEQSNSSISDEGSAVFGRK